MGPRAAPASVRGFPAAGGCHFGRGPAGTPVSSSHRVQWNLSVARHRYRQDFTPGGSSALLMHAVGLTALNSTFGKRSSATGQSASELHRKGPSIVFVELQRAEAHRKSWTMAIPVLLKQS